MKYFIAIALISLSLCSFGQRGRPVYLDIDTLKGADTVYIELPELTGFYALDWEVKFYEVGGTSDGTGFLQIANDTLGFVNVNEVAGIITAFPNDTITIADQVLYKFQIYGTASNKYRYQLIGTVGDTTRIISNYILKK